MTERTPPKEPRTFRVGPNHKSKNIGPPLYEPSDAINRRLEARRAEEMWEEAMREYRKE